MAGPFSIQVNHFQVSVTHLFCFHSEKCKDENSKDDCAKIVKKDQCQDKGDKCMKSCDMCETTTTSSTTTTAEGEYVLLLASEGSFTLLPEGR